MKKSATGRTLTDADAIEVAEIFHEVVDDGRGAHATTVVDILTSFSQEDLAAIDAAYRALDCAKYPDILSAVQAETSQEISEALIELASRPGR